ncbi:ABC transporter permease [bacterium]|jgi:lipoprotein-releasing system permease protein|nr:ABC transporter permease [bacterium]
MAGKSAVSLIARRFLLSKSSDQFISFIAWVSVVGVALGVLSLTVVTSVINGFEGELAKVITGTNGDVILYTRSEPIANPRVIESKVKHLLPNLRAITASFVTEIMVSGPNGVAGAVVEGVDLTTLNQVTTIPQKIIRGKMPASENEVAMGYALAERLGAKVGSAIRLIAPAVSDGEGSSEPKVMQAVVVGLAKMGMYEYDSKFIYTPIASVQKFLQQPGKVTALKMKLAPYADSRKASGTLSSSFGYPFRAKDWGQLNKNLFYAIKLEKVVIAIILTIIVIVAAFNVVSTLMMMIHDKTKEISILKVMGFSKSQNFRLFCIVGVGIGAIGTTAGVLLGLVLNQILERTRWIELPPDIYYINFLPVVVRWEEVGITALAALVITFLAAIYPAYRVSIRSPMDGIRYE